MGSISPLAPASSATRLIIEDGIVYFQPPYPDPWFLEDMSKIVPSNERHWYPHKQAWAFFGPHLETLRALIAQSFGSEPTVETRSTQ
jgi:hypothetical protein